MSFNLRFEASVLAQRDGFGDINLSFESCVDPTPGYRSSRVECECVERVRLVNGGPLYRYYNCKWKFLLTAERHLTARISIPVIEYFILRREAAVRPEALEYIAYFLWEQSRFRRWN